MIRVFGALAIFTLIATANIGADAEEYMVEMRNTTENGNFRFVPSLLRLEPGDSVRFVPVDPGHNAETLPGMVPDGAEPFRGGINEEFVVSFETEGVYGYKCLPHYALGQVGLIIVGDPAANVEAAAAVSHPGQASTAFEDLFAELELAD